MLNGYLFDAFGEMAPKALRFGLCCATLQNSVGAGLAMFLPQPFKDLSEMVWCCLRPVAIVQSGESGCRLPSRVLAEEAIGRRSAERSMRPAPTITSCAQRNELLIIS